MEREIINKTITTIVLIAKLFKGENIKITILKNLIFLKKEKLKEIIWRLLSNSQKA